MIFYDSDWNPTVDQQAMDRAHRLGQTKQVFNRYVAHLALSIWFDSTRFHAIARLLCPGDGVPADL